MPPNNPFTGQPNPSTPPATAPVSASTPVAPKQQAAGSGQQTAEKPTPKNQNSAQSSLQLSEIRDNMVIMTDGSLRAVISCQSINFDLMSDKEREGVEYSYQQFLNSLNFPIQILVRSQRVDIGPYLDKLIDTRRNQDNMLLGVLMDDYINYIDALAEGANIMEKSFYIVIPYFPHGDAANLIDQGKGFFGKLFARPKNTITRINAADYQKAKDEIKNRVDAVMAGLFQIGIQSVQMETKALGELYYNFYNPDTAVRQPLGNFNQVTSTYIKKGSPADAQQGGGVQ